MGVAEVVDRDTLQAYLNGLSENTRVATTRYVASRAALRVAPVALRFFAENMPIGKRDLTALPVWGAITISEVSCTTQTFAIDAHAAFAAAHAAATAATAAAETAYSAASAAETAYSAATIATIAVDATRTAARAASAAAADTAADTAAYAAADAAVIWEAVRADLREDPPHTLVPLWSETKMPSEIAQDWRAAKIAFDADRNDWRFWVTWYERVLAGKDAHPDLLAPILSKLTKEDWLGDPAKVTPLFDDVLALYHAEDANGALRAAIPVQFTFEQMLRVMRLVGKDQSTDHLRDPLVVQSFLDDARNVREGFEDFVDDAREIQGGNFVGVLRKRAEKILKEFDRARDDTHLNAERIVMLANDLEIYSKDEKAATDLGATLTQVLDGRLDSLKSLCRTHFGPAYKTLAPLANLNFDQIDQAEVIRLFDDAIAWLARIEDGDLIPLDAEGVAVFRDMQNELHDFRAAIQEADTDAFRKILDNRFASRSGAMGLALGRFVEQSASAAGKANIAADQLVKGHKRATSLAEIMKPIVDFLLSNSTT